MTKTIDIKSFIDLHEDRKLSFFEKIQIINTLLVPRDVAAAPQTPQLGGAQTNFGGPS